MTTFKVNSNLDVVDPKDGVLTLREAIEAANSNAGKERIRFDLPFGSTINLTKGSLDITDDLKIVGFKNSDGLTVSGDGSFDIFTVGDEIDVSFQGLTITGGDDGIVIGSDSIVTINKLAIVENHGQGIELGQGPDEGEKPGNNNLLEVTNSDISKNGLDGIEAIDEAVGNFFTVVNSTINDNGGDGIDLEDEGELNVRNSIINDNAQHAIILDDGSTALITKNEIKDNAFDSIFVDNDSTLQIIDNLISGGGTPSHSPVGGIQLGSSTSLDDSGNDVLIANNTIKNNNGIGIGIFGEHKVVIQNNHITGNSTAGDGGGVNVAADLDMTGGSDVVLTNNRIINNTADSDRDGVGDGGGIFHNDTGTVTLIGNTITDNFDLSPAESNVFPNLAGAFVDGDDNIFGNLTGATFPFTRVVQATDLPTVSLTTDKILVSEGDTFIWQFDLSQPASEGLTVDLEILANTDPEPGDVKFFLDSSTNIADFERIADENNIGLGYKITFTEGATQASFVSGINIDELVETDETLIVGLTSGDDYIIDPTQQQVSNTFTDLPAVSLTTDKILVSEGDTFAWNFNLSQPASKGLTVDLEILANTDPEPGDVKFFLDSSTNIADFERIADENNIGLGYKITFTEGATEASFVSGVNIDKLVETDETLIVGLTSGDDYIIDPTHQQVSNTFTDPITSDFNSYEVHDI